jgi:phosphatidate phosphatase APP1
MKSLLLTALLTLSFNTFAGIAIVSDLDDTIKVTHSDHFWDSFGYGVGRNKVYVGMPEFLAESRSYVSQLNLVTASPRILKGKVKRLIKKHEIKVENIVLNGNFKRMGHVEFKVNAIKKIMDNSTDQFIFLGDDVGNDPEIYDELMKLYPDRVLASYIHVVNDRPVPATMKLYLVSYELAVMENQAERLSKKAVTSVAKALMVAKDYEAVFPEFALCPKDYVRYEWLEDTEFYSEAAPILKRMVRYCKYDWEGN